MKYVWGIISPMSILLFAGCEVLHPPGIQVYQVLHGTNKYGPTEKTARIVNLNADMPGLQSVEASGVKITFDQVTCSTQTTVTDPKTGVVTVTNSTKPGGLYVSEHVTVRGQADKSRVDAGGNAVAKGIVSGAVGTTLGPAVGIGGAAVP